MKRIKMVLLAFISTFLFMGSVDAASGNINITGSTSAIKGNSVTYTVTISSSTAIGSWQVDLDYDSNYLKLTSSTAEGGGSYMVNSSSGTKSKSYTFTFKTLKTGNTSVKIGSYYVVAYDDFSSMSMKTGSRSLKIMTQEELEATYSSDATLKALSVTGYDLNPAFNKNVYEYNVEVENAITSVIVNSTKNDKNATISGGGEISLEEGNNPVTITVTAQKGNQQTYTININRKELDPITITLNNIEYKVVRKPNELVKFPTFAESTTIYNEIEIPSILSEVTNITLIGLKDPDGKVQMYVYDGTNIKEAYNEIASNQTNIYPQPLKESIEFKKYQLVDVVIGNTTVSGYQIKDNSDEVVIYALDITTNEYNYYLYNLKNNTFILNSMRKDQYYAKIIKNYQYILIGSLGLIFILLLICIFKKGNKQRTHDEPLIAEDGKEKTKKKKAKM